MIAFSALGNKMDGKNYSEVLIDIYNKSNFSCGATWCGAHSPDGAVL